MFAAVPCVSSSGIGDGLIPVPEKISKRILKLDFVDIKELKCARDFEGQAWAQYDLAFHQRMAAAKDWSWSNVNTTLFNLCFAGKARRNVACKFCTSDEHASENCLDNPVRVGPQWQNN